MSPTSDAYFLHCDGQPVFYVTEERQGEFSHFTVCGLDVLDNSDLPVEIRIEPMATVFRHAAAQLGGVWHLTGYPYKEPGEDYEVPFRQYTRYYRQPLGCPIQDEAMVPSAIFIWDAFAYDEGSRALTAQIPSLAINENRLRQGIIDDGIALYAGFTESSDPVQFLLEKEELPFDSWPDEVVKGFRAAIYTGDDGDFLRIVTRESGSGLIQELLEPAKKFLEANSWWQENRHRLTWNQEEGKFFTPENLKPNTA